MRPATRNLPMTVDSVAGKDEQPAVRRMLSNSIALQANLPVAGESSDLNRTR